ncbi:MAG: insulinase family protein [Myxococcales bacterium]|nr:insulinase family protein [Myxococcales bacterium]
MSSLCVPRSSERAAHVAAFVASTLALSACVPALPGPTTPLVLSPAPAAEPPPSPAIAAPELPRVFMHRVTGGMSVWVIPTPDDEGDVRIELVTRRGDDGAHPRGIVSVLAHGLHEHLKGRVEGADVWAGSSSRMAKVGMSVASASLEPALEAIHAAVAVDALDADPIHRAWARWRHSLMDPSPSARVKLVGLAQLFEEPASVDTVQVRWLQRIAGFTREGVTAARDERFAPRDSVLVVVGPVDPVAIAEVAERVFGGWSIEPTPPVSPAMPERFVARAAVSEHSPGAQVVSVEMIRRAPPMSDPNRPAFDLVVEILGGGASARLHSSLRDQQQLTYGGAAGVSDAYYGDVLHLVASFSPDEAEVAMDRLFDEERRLRDEPVTEAELRVARVRLWAGLRHGLEQNPSGWLERAWIARVTPAALLRRYEALATITPAELQEVSRRYLDPAQGLVLVVGDLTHIGGLWIRRGPEGLSVRRRVARDEQLPPPE